MSLFHSIIKTLTLLIQKLLFINSNTGFKWIFTNLNAEPMVLYHKTIIYLFAGLNLLILLFIHSSPAQADVTFSGTGTGGDITFSSMTGSWTMATTGASSETMTPRTNGVSFEYSGSSSWDLSSTFSISVSRGSV